MTDAVAIDFGTSRTKLAYLSPGAGRAEVVRLGEEGFYLPSLFYLPHGSADILLGDDAQDMLEEDPAGIVDVLKRRLRNPYVYANRRRVRPVELLVRLFAELRERTGREVLAFAGRAPARAVLTLPVLYGPVEEGLLRQAAETAGFTDVELVPEPVAAARAWLAETGEAADGVVVLDCGGGTLDWAHLRRSGGDFSVVPECPPGGDDKVGVYCTPFSKRRVREWRG